MLVTKLKHSLDDLKSVDHISLFSKNIYIYFQRTILIIIIQLGAQGHLHILKGNLCSWPLYVQVHRFPPGWWSDPGPPVTLWMIAVTETCLIPALMLGFWWPTHFDAVTRSNPTPPSVTHIYTVDQIAPSDLVSKQEVLFPSSHFDPEHWYLSYFWHSASTQ